MKQIYFGMYFLKCMDFKLLPYPLHLPGIYYEPECNSHAKGITSYQNCGCLYWFEISSYSSPAYNFSQFMLHANLQKMTCRALQSYVYFLRRKLIYISPPHPNLYRIRTVDRHLLLNRYPLGRKFRAHNFFCSVDQALQVAFLS